MAPRIPKAFGKKDNKSGPSTLDKARPQNPKDADAPPSDIPPNQVDASRKRSHPDNRDPSKDPKKNRSEDASSSAESQLGPLAVQFFKEKNLKSWQSMRAEEENEALIQASVQLLSHSLGRAQKLAKERAFINKLELEKKKLSEIILESDNKWKKTCDGKDKIIASMKEEISDYEANLLHFHKTIDQLKSEKANMEARLNILEAEKQDIEDQGFQNGFDFYLTGFLANDPEYNWEEKFGKESAEEIREFRILHADLIREKRVELGLEKPLEGAPSKEDATLISEQALPTVNTEATPNLDLPSTSTTVPSEGAPKENDAT